MVPGELTAASFTKYPPEARKKAVAFVALLHALPLAFLPSMLRELVDLDYKFPAERRELEHQLAYLAKLNAAELSECFADFRRLRLTSAQAALDWVNQPLAFTEQFSAYLWSTGQMDSFRQAARAYGERLHAALPAPPPAMRRLGISVIGQGANASAGIVLFQRLRKHGTVFSSVDAKSGLKDILSSLEARVAAQPASYAHWYVDGGTSLPHDGAMTCVSYEALTPVRDAILDRIQRHAAQPGSGPESLRDYLAALSPATVGMQGDPALAHFQLKILTEGSGTQIFSTTFAQWTAREALRRAEPLTLLVRFAPRQRQRPMNELLSRQSGTPELDPNGSLIDADMASYYHWIGQQRLTGASESSFLVWWEGQREALVIGPGLPKGTQSNQATNMKSILRLLA